jgi:hypothetical protein
MSGLLRLGGEAYRDFSIKLVRQGHFIESGLGNKRLLAQRQANSRRFGHAVPDQAGLASERLTQV